MVDAETCVTNSHKSTTDLILKNTPSSFQKSMATETGLSDFYKLVSTFFKSHYSRLKPKIVYYRNFKNFNKSNFLKDLSNNTLFLYSDEPKENYNFLTTKFQEAVSRHAPLRKKILRGNHAPFDKEFTKAIYTRSRLRNKSLKNSTKGNESLFKKQLNKCVLLRKKCINNYFSKVTGSGVNTNKEFWKIIKPFLTNKRFLSGNEIRLIENYEVITEEKILPENFKDHYTNTVEQSCRVRPTKLNLLNISFNENESIIDAITCHFHNHPRVTKIKSRFMFPQSNVDSSPR